MGEAAPAPKPIWTSLEIVKLAVPVFSAALVVLIGYLINQKLEMYKFDISKNLETYKSEIQQNSKAIDNLIERSNKIDDTLNAKRSALYDDIGKKLNQMFAYYMYFGKWKEMSPEDVIRHKRDLDETIYTYRPLFSLDFIHIYEDLMSQMFRPYGRWGKDAKLRTSVEGRQEFFLPTNADRAWKADWNERYTEEENTKQIKDSYSKLQSQLPRELGFAKTREIDAKQLGNANLPPKN